MTKKKEVKFLPEQPCKVCGRMIPKPLIYCSTKCREADKEVDNVPKVLEWDL